MKIALTHKGWFGLCPVYFGNMHSESPLVLERHPALLPLMMFSEAMFQLVMIIMDIAGQDPPGFPLRITGKLDGSRVLDVPDEA